MHLTISNHAPDPLVHGRFAPLQSQSLGIKVGSLHASSFTWLKLMLEMLEAEIFSLWSPTGLLECPHNVVVDFPRAWESNRPR